MLQIKSKELLGSTTKESLLLGRSLYRLEGASVAFGNIVALKNISLTIEPGELIFVTGVSGSGKTTLLRLLSGELKPTSGRIERLHDIDHSLFVNSVFQDLRLVPRLTCEQNLNFAYDPSIYNSRNEFQNDMNELCRIFGISDRLDHKINIANGGLKQKIAIIRALLGRPNVLLADEPTSSLDNENAQKLFDVLNLYNIKRGLTVIWSTHNRDLIKRFNGRILHLEGGKLVYSGNACFI